MMTDDFFADLGETIQKAAKEFSEMTEGFFEEQKVRGKVFTENREIEKCMNKLGNLVYQKHVTGEIFSEEIADVCEEITRRKVKIAKLREEMAKAQGEKICPACGAAVAREAAYCMHCGAACEVEEPDEETAEFKEVEEAEEKQEETADSMDEGSDQ